MAALALAGRQAIRRPSPLVSLLTFSLPTLSAPLLLRPSASLLAAALLDWRRGIEGWLAERLLRAAPKKKVSHSRKRMRSAHKGLDVDNGLVSCPACGKPKRPHYLCLDCYADIMLERGHRVGTDQDPLKPNERRGRGIVL